MKTFAKILLTLIILGGLGYGGWYAYQWFYVDAPKEGTVYVQSVAAITGVGPAGQRNRYAGVVEAKNVIEVDPNDELTVKECFVSSGDKVNKGDPLFCYDVDSMQIAYDQLMLDIQGLENAIKTGREKVESLKKQLARAKANKKYDIQLEIQTEELEIRRREYELTGKRKQAEDMAAALENSVIYSPVTGTVRTVRSADGSADYDTQDTAYITIVAGDDYCVKGTVSEQTIHTLQEGMDVRVLSRVSDAKWVGYIYKINTEKAKQNSGRYYYGYDNGEQASKYEFFVELETNEGLLMGQHVYIEIGGDYGEDSDRLWLPEYYVVEDEGDPFVYAADDEGRIEKRRVVLGERDETMGTVVILEGLSYLDRIAYPDESVQVGMAVSETSYVPEGDGDMGEGYFTFDDIIGSVGGDTGEDAPAAFPLPVTPETEPGDGEALEEPAEGGPQG